MHIIHKVINFRIRTKSSTEFHSICSEKFSVLNLLNMPNVKSKKIFTGVSHDPMVKVEVLGSGARGVPSNVLLITGRERYLFNCGEGTQKLGNEYRFGIEKVSHIFITSPFWKNIGGLIGVCMVNQRANASGLFIHGHQIIGSVFTASNKFVRLRYFHPTIKHCVNYEEFSDGNISVKYVHLYSSLLRRSVSPDFVENSATENRFVENSEDESDLSSHSSENHGNGRKSKRRSSSEKHTESHKINDKHVISYIIRTQDIPGSLLYEKCVSLGVPPGPLLGVLKSGKDVTLDNGKIIKSADVKQPDSPGTNIIVLECPTTDYLDYLLQEPIYGDYQSGKNDTGAVIHFSSSEVVKNPKYQEWISCFQKETKHLFLNEDNKLSGSVGIRRLQFKLNYLVPSLFPLLEDAKIPNFPREEDCSEEKGHVLVPHLQKNSFGAIHYDGLFYKCETNSFINAETLCTLNLKPKRNYDYMNCLVLKKKEFLNEMFQDSNAKEEIEKSKNKIKHLEAALEADQRVYPKIVFLGTGSGKPSKVRNASGILIFLEENKCIMFDCGENTYNQLVNLYGIEKTSEILRKLVAIYVSHLHIDHHLGLITLLKERKAAFDKQNGQLEFQPVYLLAPLRIREWLSLYSESFDNLSGLFDLLPNAFLEKGSNDCLEKKENCLKSLNLSSLTTATVLHCNGAFGVSIVHNNGWKITYSGDTRPCDALVNLGMDSDILIHEATFENSHAYEAKIKKHSTTNEAIDIGRRMNAKFILLTHFSQRYCYLPVIEDSLRNSNIGIAFDFMEVPFNKLKLLPEMLEPLQYIFSDYDKNPKIEKMVAGLKRKQHEANLSQDNSVESSQQRVKVFKQILDL